MKTTIGISFVAALLIGGAVMLFEPPQTIDIKNDQPGLAPGPPALQTTRLLFVGDIMLDRHIRKQIEENLDPLYPFLKIANTLQNADLTVANLEGPISDRGTKVGSIYSFRFSAEGGSASGGEPNTTFALKYAGIDVVSLANNHIWDYGKTALLDTLNYLDGAQIGYAGAGRNEIEANAPHLATVGEVTIAFLSYTTLYPKSLWADSENPGISAFDLALAKERVTAIKSSGEANLVFVLFHWGEEYQAHSNASQQETAHALIDAGADLIVGHHPHVVQEIEEYKGRYIAYSLGNFVFDQNFSDDTRKGLMLEVQVRDNKIIEVRPIPIQFTKTYQPYEDLSR